MAPGAPTNTAPPVMTGIPAPGSTLSCSLGAWAGSPPLSYTIQWLRDDSPIAGQTASTYLVKTSDVASVISCRVTASNANGNATATSNARTVTTPPMIPPTISALSETRKVFGPSGRHRKRGTRFSFRLDRPAQVTMAIQRKTPGRRVGQSCRHPSSRLRHKPRCIRMIPIAALIKQGRSGLNEIAFSGRVRGRALNAGHYLAIFSATAAGGTSKPRMLPFRIVRH